jgi:hypothetical protein
MSHTIIVFLSYREALIATAPLSLAEGSKKIARDSSVGIPVGIRETGSNHSSCIVPVIPISK